MATKYTSKKFLEDTKDDVDAILVKNLRPVVADEPNRAALALAESTDYLAGHYQVQGPSIDIFELPHKLKFTYAAAPGTSNLFITGGDLLVRANIKLPEDEDSYTLIKFLEGTYSLKIVDDGIFVEVETGALTTYEDTDDPLFTHEGVEWGGDPLIIRLGSVQTLQTPSGSIRALIIGNYMLPHGEELVSGRLSGTSITDEFRTYASMREKTHQFSLINDEKFSVDVINEGGVEKAHVQGAGRLIFPEETLLQPIRVIWNVKLTEDKPYAAIKLNHEYAPADGTNVNWFSAEAYSKKDVATAYDDPAGDTFVLLGFWDAVGTDQQDPWLSDNRLFYFTTPFASVFQAGEEAWVGRLGVPTAEMISSLWSEGAVFDSSDKAKDFKNGLYPDPSRRIFVGIEPNSSSDALNLSINPEKKAYALTDMDGVVGDTGEALSLAAPYMRANEGDFDETVVSDLEVRPFSDTTLTSVSEIFGSTLRIDFWVAKPVILDFDFVSSLPSTGPPPDYCDIGINNLVVKLDLSGPTPRYLIRILSSVSEEARAESLVLAVMSIGQFLRYEPDTDPDPGDYALHAAQVQGSGIFFYRSESEEGDELALYAETPQGTVDLLDILDGPSSRLIPGSSRTESPDSEYLHPLLLSNTPKIPVRVKVPDGIVKVDALKAAGALIEKLAVQSVHKDSKAWATNADIDNRVQAKLVDPYQLGRAIDAIPPPPTVDFATKAEAEAGTNSSKVMSPLRTKEAIDAQRPFATQSEAIAGTSSTTVMSPARTHDLFSRIDYTPYIVLKDSPDYSVGHSTLSHSGPSARIDVRVEWGVGPGGRVVKLDHVSYSLIIDRTEPIYVHVTSIPTATPVDGFSSLQVLIEWNPSSSIPTDISVYTDDPSKVVSGFFLSILGTLKQSP